jgi:hypothetical protein
MRGLVLQKSDHQELLARVRDGITHLERLVAMSIELEPSRRRRLQAPEEAYSSDGLRWLRSRSQHVHESYRIHDENVNKLVPESGEWFLCSPEYRDWVSRPGATLFAPGIPGSGKSTMVSVVLNDLRQRLGSDARLAWFWFDPRQWGQGEDGHTPNFGIADLALLLCSEYADAGNRLPPGVVSVLEGMVTRRSMATTTDLSYVLQALGAPASRVFLLFDAVDLAPEDVRATLLLQIQDLQDSLGLNIFATALLGSGIDESLPQSTSLEIRASAMEVARYLNRGLNSDRRLRWFVDSAENRGLRHKIVQTTVDMSDGMSVISIPFPSPQPCVTLADVATWTHASGSSSHTGRLLPYPSWRAVVTCSRH